MHTAAISSPRVLIEDLDHDLRIEDDHSLCSARLVRSSESILSFCLNSTLPLSFFNASMEFASSTSLSKSSLKLSFLCLIDVSFLYTLSLIVIVLVKVACSSPFNRASKHTFSNLWLALSGTNGLCRRDPISSLVEYLLVLYMLSFSC